MKKIAGDYTLFNIKEVLALRAFGFKVVQSGTSDAFFTIGSATIYVEGYSESYIQKQIELSNRNNQIDSAKSYIRESLKLDKLPVLPNNDCVAVLRSVINDARLKNTIITLPQKLDDNKKIDYKDALLNTSTLTIEDEFYSTTKAQHSTFAAPEDVLRSILGNRTFYTDGYRYYAYVLDEQYCIDVPCKMTVDGFNWILSFVREHNRAVYEATSPYSRTSGEGTKIRLISIEDGTFYDEEEDEEYEVKADTFFYTGELNEDGLYDEEERIYLSKPAIVTISDLGGFDISGLDAPVFPKAEYARYDYLQGTPYMHSSLLANSYFNATKTTVDDVDTILDSAESDEEDDDDYSLSTEDDDYSEYYDDDDYSDDAEEANGISLDYLETGEYISAFYNFLPKNSFTLLHPQFSMDEYMRRRDYLIGFYNQLKPYMTRYGCKVHPILFEDTEYAMLNPALYLEMSLKGMVADETTFQPSTFMEKGYSYLGSADKVSRLVNTAYDTPLIFLSDVLDINLHSSNNIYLYSDRAPRFTKLVDSSGNHKFRYEFSFVIYAWSVWEHAKHKEAEWAFPSIEGIYQKEDDGLYYNRFGDMVDIFSPEFLLTYTLSEDISTKNAIRKNLVQYINSNAEFMGTAKLPEDDICEDFIQGYLPWSIQYSDGIKSSPNRFYNEHLYSLIFVNYPPSLAEIVRIFQRKDGMYCMLLRFDGVKLLEYRKLYKEGKFDVYSRLQSLVYTNVYGDEYIVIPFSYNVNKHGISDEADDATLYLFRENLVSAFGQASPDSKVFKKGAKYLGSN